MERKLIDMHMHTCYSDGELTPDELIEYAISCLLINRLTNIIYRLKGLVKPTGITSYVCSF